MVFSSPDKNQVSRSSTDRSQLHRGTYLSPDEISDLARDLLDVERCVMAFADRDTLWLAGDPVEDGECAAIFQVMNRREPGRDRCVEIEDFRMIPEIRTPVVEGGVELRHYASVPIRLNPSVTGALVVLGRTPRELTNREINILNLLARQASTQLEKLVSGPFAVPDRICPLSTEGRAEPTK